MKKLFALVSAVALTLTLAACGGESTETETTTKAVTTTAAAENAATTTKAADTTTTTAAADESAQNVTVTETLAADIQQSPDIDISFAQAGGVTVVTVTSPYVSQFTEEAQKLANNVNYAEFSVQFYGVDDWKQGFSFDFSYDIVDVTDDNEFVFYPHGLCDVFSVGQHLSSGLGELTFEVNGDTAVWSVPAVGLSLDNIADVLVSAKLDYSNPDDKLFFESVPVEQVAVSDSLPPETSAETAVTTAPAVPLGGTIAMPDGFPSNPGDLEHFKPLTDDYIYRKNADVSSTDWDANYTLLVSFDESGSIVQFAAKVIYDSADEMDPAGYMEEYGGDLQPHMTVIGNVMFIDYLAVDGFYSEDGIFSQSGWVVINNRPIWHGVPASRMMYEANKTNYSGEDWYVSKSSGGAAATTTAATTTAALSSSITGTYRSAKYSPYIDSDEMIDEIINSGDTHMLYDYVNITQLDDGSYQAAFMSEVIGRYDDFAFYDSEGLGTSAWMSYDSVTGEAFSLGDVTVTADGNTAWVTFEGEEPQEYIKTE